MHRSDSDSKAAEKLAFSKVRSGNRKLKDKIEVPRRIVKLSDSVNSEEIPWGYFHLRDLRRWTIVLHSSPSPSGIENNTLSHEPLE